jgi:hypothetical protein
MERIDYVARAKRLLTQSARTAALVIVPLAAAATAHATTAFIMPTGNFACSADGDASSNCSDVVQVNGPFAAANGFEGMSFSNQLGQDVSIGVSSGGAATLQMSAGGSTSETLDQDVPVGWNFTLADTGTVVITGWSLTFKLGSSAGNSTYGSLTTTGGAATGTFTGSNTIPVSIDSSGTIFETVVLTVTDTGTGNVNITFPFYVGSQGWAVPEPATVGTLGAGLGFLAWLYRRRKRA